MNKIDIIFIAVVIIVTIGALFVGVAKEQKRVEAPTTYHLKIEKLTVHKVK